jgi:hypothetical protein
LCELARGKTNLSFMLVKREQKIYCRKGRSPFSLRILKQQSGLKKMRSQRLSLSGIPQEVSAQKKSGDQNSSCRFHSDASRNIRYRPLQNGSLRCRVVVVIYRTWVDLAKQWNRTQQSRARIRRIWPQKCGDMRGYAE